jgi:hypothetical protein
VAALVEVVVNTVRHHDLRVRSRLLRLLRARKSPSLGQLESNKTRSPLTCGRRPPASSAETTDSISAAVYQHQPMLDSKGLLAA